jgi:hypothetical protein
VVQDVGAAEVDELHDAERGEAQAQAEARRLVDLSALAPPSSTMRAASFITSACRRGTM